MCRHLSVPDLVPALWTMGEPSWPLPSGIFQPEGGRKPTQEARMATVRSICLFGRSECALAGKSGEGIAAKRQQ